MSEEGKGSELINVGGRPKRIPNPGNAAADNSQDKKKNPLKLGEIVE